MKPSLLLLLLLLFAIAMGYLESAVVVYIRALYYPQGFLFPLKLISRQIMFTEMGRELATIIMLLTVAILTGKNSITRFAFFLFAFAIWDIFYYVFLYLILGWPQTFLTWDLLFFIPTVWTGPVIAPLINCIIMIAISLIIIIHQYQPNTGKILPNPPFCTGWLVWSLLILGSVLIFIAYIQEYTQYILHQYTLTQLLSPNHPPQMLSYVLAFVPQHFPWFLFLLGIKIHLWALGLMLKRNYNISIKVLKKYL